MLNTVLAGTAQPPAHASLLLVLCFLAAVPACAGDDPAASLPEADVLNEGWTPPSPTTLDGVDPQPWNPFQVWDQRAILRGFDWKNTQPLPLPAEDVGAAPVYYFQIYVRSPDELRELEELGIHYDPAPLFESEWPERPVLMTFEGDPEDGGGLFVYALMPAITYNLIREASLQGEDTYRAVILREVPEEARAADGSVSYEHLGSAFGEFAPPYQEIVDDDEVGAPPLIDGFEVQERIGRRLRRFVRRAGRVVRGVVDGVRLGIGAVIRVYKPDTRLKITLHTPNRAANMPGAMRQAWGAEFGEPVPLANTRVNVRQWRGVALYRDRSNGRGIAEVRVARGLNTKFCVEADSSAARVEHGVIWPARACSATFKPQGQTMEATYEVTGETFHALAQLIDGRRYAGRLLGFTPPKAMVQRGWVANLFAKGSRAFVPCLAATNAPNTLVDVFSGLIPAGVAVEFLMASDIVLPDGSMNGRSSGVHEYGHFFLCTLLAHESHGTFDRVWSTVTGRALLDDDSEIRGINEGFADWFASQVTGGVDYFNEDEDFGSPASENFMFDQNSVAHGRGMEANFGAPMCEGGPPFPACQPIPKSDIALRVATIATLLHDVVDLRVCDANCRESVSSTAVWRRDTSLSLSLERGAVDSFNDEDIEAAPGRITQALRDYAHAGLPLDNQIFFRFLGQELSKSYTNDQLCRLFSLHTQDQCTPVRPAGPILPPAPPLEPPVEPADPVVI